MKIEELFGAAGLKSVGKSSWKLIARTIDQRLNEPGVYVAVIGHQYEGLPLCTGKFDEIIHAEFEKTLWIRNETVLYIGQTTKQTLKKRINQFINHKYGNRSPHKGGQSIHLLNYEPVIYWSPAGSPKIAEAKMLLAFMKEHGGRLPYANRDFPSRRVLLSSLEP